MSARDLTTNQASRFQYGAIIFNRIRLWCYLPVGPEEAEDLSVASSGGVKGSAKKRLLEAPVI